MQTCMNMQAVFLLQLAKILPGKRYWILDVALVETVSILLKKVVLSRTSVFKSNIYTMGVKETMHWIPIENIGEYKAFPIFMKEYLQSPSQWDRTHYNG